MNLSQAEYVETLAQTAHEANRAYCQAIGDHSQPSWDDAPDWQKDSARNGVKGILNGDGPEQSHESWLAQKKAEGWKYGEVKNPDLKEHPCFVPYAELPVDQQTKDHVFAGVIRAMYAAMTGEPT
jgi:hypothetical protein